MMTIFGLKVLISLLFPHFCGLLNSGELWSYFDF